MKTSQIEPGKTYLVRLTEQQSVVWRGCKVHAKVIRCNFYYDVDYVTGSMVRGAPFHRTQRSAYPQGVEVEWETQDVESYKRNRFGGTERVQAGRAVVNARAVQFELEDES